MSATEIEHQDTEVEEDNVEYELLDVPVYTDSSQEILDTEASTDEQHEIIQGQHLEGGGVMDDPEEQEVEYIEAEEIPYDSDITQLPTGHTIFVHDGKQYMIPNSLHQNGQTLVFQEESEEDTAVPGPEVVEYEPVEDDEYVLESVNHVELEEHTETAADDVPVQLEQDGECYLMYGDEADGQEEQDVGAVPLGRQYAVLKNGKLHITSGQQSTTGGSDDMQEKLQALEDTLNYVDVDMDTTSTAEHSEEDLTNGEHIDEITGRNLITGQTISLSGFLEKIKRKVDDPLDASTDAPRAKRRRRTETPSAPQRPEYVLVPPVNKRVVVGKTADGKRIVGKILQIQKKIPQHHQQQQEQRSIKKHQQLRQQRSKPPPRPVAPEVEETRRIEELIIDNTGKILNVDDTTATGGRNVVVKKKIVTRTYLDQNIVRTLSGLMELQSIERHLSHKNLIVKHVLKKSIEGQVLTGKQVTYYYGYMQRTETIDCYNNEPRPTWTFVSNHLQEEETEDGEQQQQQSINLSEDANHDSQQVNVSVNADGKITFIGDSSSGSSERVSIKQEPCVYDETVTVNLIVTQDEHGRKRTKVIIPQLAANVGVIKCQTCGRGFKSEQHLRRHVNQHHTSTSGGDSADITSSAARYTCDLCNRTFSDMETLFRHSRLHGSAAEDMSSSTSTTTTGSRFTCNICNKSFNTTGSLRRHMTVHYPSLRPLQCMTCLQRFTDESSLKKHMLMHTGIRPFQCPVCSRTFVHQGDLNFHKKIHDLVKRYRCDVCGKEFNRHSNMVRHAEIHRPQSSAMAAAAAASTEGGGPPYTCDTCGCQYNFVSSLTRHIVNNHMGAANGTVLGSSVSYLAGDSEQDQHRTAVDSITSHNEEHSS